MNKDINSNDLNRAMLRAKLSGNEIRVMLAYVDKGGWKAGTEVFLPKSVKEEYGLSDSTVKRARKTLVAQGWLIPTGKKSHWGCDMYLCAIPSGGGGPEAPRGSAKTTPWVGRNEPPGGSFRSTEVTKEVMKRSNEVSNEEEQRSARRASQPEAKASDLTRPDDKKIKDKDNGANGPRSPSLNDLIELDWDTPVYAGTKKSGVVQNEPPLQKRGLVQVGELDW